MEFPIVIRGYRFDESNFIFRGIRCNFSFLFHFSMKIKIANRIAPDGTPRFAASHLVIFFLPMFHKKDARLIWINRFRLHSKDVIDCLMSEYQQTENFYLKRWPKELEAS